ncbi:hypothetical protein A5672_25875 [Mycobacterium alsense]|uniref:CDGP domain-containing protein n=1 Tax=Mycobacterium alsense TaxID=324058 RepID=A0ABD6NYZ0_9MYCO|nr:hypothetical protein [Mycobacterium alsense]OBG32278.1 hypothetical protein A5672_25875 [Mycobacterium alsense]OBI97153.1 hypothetical protein A5660_06880 [Mycobacterium alsense]
MRQCIVTGLAVLLSAIGLVAAAPPAAAGCLYGGPVLSKCDGPLQPDGSWERCVAVTNLVLHGASSYLVPEKHCGVMGPGQNLGGVDADPPTHIDG